jgi:hypothetical protein
MQLDVWMDSRVLEDKLALLAREARVSQAQVIKEEARFIVQGVMKLTPPSTYAQGRKAVNRDLGKVFSSIGAIKKKLKTMSFTGKAQYEAALTRAVQDNDENAVRELLTRPISGQETVTVRPYQRQGQTVAGYTTQRSFSGPTLANVGGGTQIGGTLNPNLHTSRRDNHGRVKGNELSQVVIKNKPLNDYRKEVLSRVGWHIAGWIPLARKVGAKIPAWAGKTRLEASSGTATVNFSNQGKSFVAATNFDVKIPNYQRVVNSVMAARIRIAGRKLDALIQGRAVNLGFTRIAARR